VGGGWFAAGERMIEGRRQETLGLKGRSFAAGGQAIKEIKLTKEHRPKVQNQKWPKLQQVKNTSENYKGKAERYRTLLAP